MSLVSGDEVRRVFAALDGARTDDSTCESLAQQLRAAFPADDLFRVATAVVLLLQDGSLLDAGSTPGATAEAGPFVLSPAERLAALYFVAQVGQGAFESFFLEQLDGMRHHSLAERQFLIRLMTSELSQQADVSPKEFLERFRVDGKILEPEADMEKIRNTIRARTENAQITNPLKSLGIPRILPDPFIPALSKSNADSLDVGSQLEDELSSASFCPEFFRPAPPPLEVEQSELLWLDLSLPRELMWDPTMCSDTSRGSEVKKIFSLGIKKPLSDEERQKVVSRLNEDPKLVHQCGMSPKRLPDLVENNPQLATDFLQHLISVSSSQVTEYFSVLVNMNMSVQSMEVVQALSSAVEVPQEFIHLYITNSISSCESIKDKHYQTRIVRLVCVFLQSLIKNKTLNVDDLFIELQAFCIEFSRVKEAAVLFRTLKSMGTPVASSDSFGDE